MTNRITLTHDGFYVVYRISDKGYNPNKLKIANATKEHCLQNAIDQFGRERIQVIAYNCSEQLVSFIREQGLQCEETHLGNSQSFKYAVDYALKTYSGDDIVYFLEDDYLHLADSMQLIIEGLRFADYVTLYDHPDQYITYTFKHNGAAPFNRFAVRRSRLFAAERSHWREIPSTTMTFAARVRTLREDRKILQHHPNKGVPEDFAMFLALTKHRNVLDLVNVLLMRRYWPVMAMLRN